ncbi:MAG: hypothetical protein LBQ78_03785 [Tannerellaceae bacterium]|jgi:hypothetical protein|nr:hypothetical protein [Tannerellaceae bacterium]
MDYNTFRQTIIHEHGELLYAAIVEIFFAQAVEFAENGQLDEAVEVCSDALVFAKYSDIGYAVIYLLGMLCEVYLNNGQPEFAENVFKMGVEIIRKGEKTGADQGTYSSDIDAFLDLKIQIDKALLDNV